MDHYGPTAANPTPPSVELPPDTVVEQWLEPAWNWANLSAISGAGYLGRPDAVWPATLRGGFSSLVTLGWYLDNTAVNTWADQHVARAIFGSGKALPFGSGKA